MCSKLKLLDKHKFKYIKKVGVELEGAWDFIPDFQIFADGSVLCEGIRKGESHTEPKETLLEVFDELVDKYPDILNDSCGMHVHLSMPELYYAYLCSSDFWTYFTKHMQLLIDYVDRSGIEVDRRRLELRLNGDNSTCMKDFRADKQIRDKDKGSHRYCQLNFCHRLHGTLECRVLPMFMGISNAKMAICHLCWVIESFLDTYKEQEHYKLYVAIPDDVKGMSVKETICV